MARTLLLALDAGGGGGHATVVDATAGVLARAHRPWRHPTAPNTSGLGIDADLEAIWGALASAAREALAACGAAASEVAGVAATSMRHSTVVLDRAGTTLFAAPNRDGRAILETFEVMERAPADLYDLTGHWPTPVATAMRWRWLTRNRPEIVRHAAVLLSLSDWIAFRLCGERASEPSQASETMLLELALRGWSPGALGRFEVPRAVLPPLVEAGTRLGTLQLETARALGLEPGIAVAMAGGDSQCGTLGAGAVEIGAIAAIGGTTMPFQMVVDRPQLDPERRIWSACFLGPDRWVVESNAGPVGEVLEWFAQLLAPEAAAAIPRLFAEASRSVPGAAGGFSTLGGTVMDARTLELPVGHVTLSHLATIDDPARRSHLARAVVEGMAYAARGNLEQVHQVAGRTAEHVHFGGGLARSRVFSALLADVFGRPVVLGRAFDATAVGTAICAGVGAGVFRDLAEGVRALAAPSDTCEPDAADGQVYQDRYEAWRRLRRAQAAADAAARDAILPTILAGLDRSSGVAAAPARMVGRMASRAAASAAAWARRSRRQAS